MFLFVRFVLDDTFKSQEDIERYLGVTPLAVVPEANLDDKMRKRGKSISRNRGYR